MKPENSSWLNYSTRAGSGRVILAGSVEKLYVVQVPFVVIEESKVHHLSVGH